MERLLIKKEDCVKYGKVIAILYTGNGISLKWQKIRIWNYKQVKLSNINYCAIFCISIRAKLLNYKNQKAKKCVRLCISQVTLTLNLVEGIIDKLF